MPNYIASACKSSVSCRASTASAGPVVGFKVVAGSIIILLARLSFLFLASILLFSGTAGAQSASPYPEETQVAPGGNAPAESSSVFAAALPSPFPEASSSSLDSAITPAAAGVYVPPTQAQRFRNYTWNALGPVAFAGSSFAAAIDQGFNFPHEWGQGADAYGARVASNLGISLVTATAQYSLAEAFHEDTAYYRCACKGFFPRFWHAAVSTVASRRGADGHYAFSPALSFSPFVGPMLAANSWIPGHDGPTLGFNMGVHNLMGQFGQDEALEFLYGGPNTVLGRIQRHFRKASATE
jgi:hypothetical protein